VNPTSSTVRIPSETLAVLADGCGDLGAGGVSALREAGRVAGEALLDGLGVDPDASDADEFWEAVGQEFVDFGLGPVTYRLRSPGVGEVRLEGVPEADGADGEPRRLTGCPFSTGLLGGLLTGAAGEPVSVLEVECRAGGAAFCRFLVGSEARLAAIRDRMASGEPLGAVLEER
jgi:predicted hydrocarbon binding protein